MTQQEQHDLCSAITLKMKEIFGERLVSVILYGSYARGDSDEESDVDIAVVAKGSRAELAGYRNAMAHAMTDFMMDYGILVSLTEIPSDEFQYYSDVLPYYRNILREGVLLSA